VQFASGNDCLERGRRGRIRIDDDDDDSEIITTPEENPDDQKKKWPMTFTEA